MLHKNKQHRKTSLNSHKGRRGDQKKKVSGNTKARQSNTPSKKNRSSRNDEKELKKPAVKKGECLSKTSGKRRTNRKTYSSGKKLSGHSAPIE